MQKYGINTQHYEKGIEGEREDNGSSLIITRGEDLYKNPYNPDIENWRDY